MQAWGWYQGLGLRPPICHPTPTPNPQMSASVVLSLPATLLQQAQLGLGLMEYLQTLDKGCGGGPGRHGP